MYVVKLSTLIYEFHLLLFELSQCDYKWRREAGTWRLEHAMLMALKIEKGPRANCKWFLVTGKVKDEDSLQESPEAM